MCQERSLGLSSPFLGVPCSSGKKRRSLVQVFEDQGMEHLYVWNFSMKFGMETICV